MKQNLVVIFWCEWNVHTGVLSGIFISVVCAVLKLSPRATDNSVGGECCAVPLRVCQGIAQASASKPEPKPASTTATSRGVRTANDKLPASDLLAPSSNLSWMMDHLALSWTHLSRAELEFTSDDGRPTPPTRTPLVLADSPNRSASKQRLPTHHQYSMSESRVGFLFHIAFSKIYSRFKIICSI